MAELLTFDQAVEELIDRAQGRRDVYNRIVDALDEAQLILAGCDVEMPELEVTKAFRTQKYRAEYFLMRDLGIRDLVGIRHMKLMNQSASSGLDILTLPEDPNGGQRAISVEGLWTWLGIPLSREISIGPSAPVPPTIRTYFTEDLTIGGTPQKPVEPSQMPNDAPGTTTIEPTPGIPLQDEYQQLRDGTTPVPRIAFGIAMHRFRWRDYRRFSSQAKAPPIRYARHGMSLALDPVPDSVYPILIDYRRFPRKRTIETSTPLIEHLLTLALHIVWKQLQEYQLAQGCFQQLPPWLQFRISQPMVEAAWEAYWDEELRLEAV